MDLDSVVELYKEFKQATYEKLSKQGTGPSFPVIAFVVVKKNRRLSFIGMLDGQDEADFRSAIQKDLDNGFILRALYTCIEIDGQDQDMVSVPEDWLLENEDYEETSKKIFCEVQVYSDELFSKEMQDPRRFN